MDQLPDFRKPKTFLWIASDADPRIFLQMKKKQNVKRINTLNKVWRIRSDAKLYAERCAEDPQFRRALFGKYYNRRFLENLQDARDSETPIIIIFCGELAGGAKSFSALKLALYLDEFFTLENLFMDEQEFNLAAMENKIAAMKCYIFDDPDDRRTGAGAIARRERLEIFLRKVARFEKTDFLYCSALPLEVAPAYKNVLYYLESIGKNKEKNLAYFMLYDRKKRALGIVTFRNLELEKPDLINAYLEIKGSHTGRLLTTGGRQDTHDIQAAALQVVENDEFWTCINPRNNQIVISKLAALVYELFPDSEKTVSLITRKIERMSKTGEINLDQYLTNFYSTPTETTILTGDAFVFNLDQHLEDLSLISTWARKVEMYKQQYQQGKTQDEIALDFNLSQVRISQLVREVKGELARRLGEDYEIFLAAKYEKDPEVTRVIHDGTTGQPDLIIYYLDGSIEIISAKCYSSSLARASINLKIKEFLPEIETAQNLQRKKPDLKIKCLLDYYNIETDQHIVREIDFNNPPKTINIQRL